MKSSSSIQHFHFKIKLHFISWVAEYNIVLQLCSLRGSLEPLFAETPYDRQAYNKVEQAPSLMEPADVLLITNDRSI